MTILPKGNNLLIIFIPKLSSDTGNEDGVNCRIVVSYISQYFFAGVHVLYIVT
jgi:hypothetical protein